MEAMDQEINPFASINETVAEEQHISFTEYASVIGGFLHWVLSVVGTSALIFLIVVICRYKRLKTRTNFLLLNLFAVGSLPYVVTTSFFFVDVFGLWYNFLLIDVMSELRNVAMMLYEVFAVMLALDWILGGLQREFSEKLRRHDKLIYSLFYLAGALVFTVAVVHEETHHYLLKFTYSRYLEASCVLVMVTLNMLRRKMTVRIDASSLRTEYSLYVSNVVIFFLLPYLLWYFVYLFVKGHFFLYLLEIMPAATWVAHPVFLVYKLGVWDKNFKMAYAKALRRSSVRNYDDDGLDEEETECDAARVSVGDVETGAVKQSEIVI